MPIIRHMTPEEEDFWGPTVPGVVDKDILLRGEDYTPKTVRHEIGHIQYPVEIPAELGKSLTPGYYVQYLFGELCADYFSLEKVPRDKVTRENIKFDKRWARAHGLTREMISRLDKTARDRVGYKGKEVR